MAAASCATSVVTSCGVVSWLQADAESTTHATLTRNTAGRCRPIDRLRFNDVKDMRLSSFHPGNLTAATLPMDACAKAYHASRPVPSVHLSEPGAVSSEGRNISVIIRVTDSEEARCSVDEQTMAGD